MTDFKSMHGFTHFVRERCEGEPWRGTWDATLSGATLYAQAQKNPEMEATTIWDLYEDACNNRDRFQATLCRPDILEFLEPGGRKYDDVLLPFLALMREELHANAHKGDRPGWLGMDQQTALLEIFYHLGKLQRAVKDGDPHGIREYAADTANMCMMLVDLSGYLTNVPAVPALDDVELREGQGKRPRAPKIDNSRPL